MSETEMLNKITALEAQFQGQKEVIDKLNLCVNEFHSLLTKMNEICDFEIDLHKCGLKH